MKRFLGIVAAVAALLIVPALARAQNPGPQGPPMFSANCAKSPQYGKAVACYDTTLNAWYSWSGSVFVPNQVGEYATSTVAGLASCTTSNAGTLAVVTDSTSVATEGQACAGSSTHTAVAICNGAAWHCF